MSIALITGASSGIGKQLARIHAQRGGDLVVVARSEDRLGQLKDELESKFNNTVIIIAKDLSSAESAKELYDQVQSLGVPVDILINNAGFGGRGKFHERDWDQDYAMIQLNIIALTALCRCFLPDFVARNSGKILNVSSTASLVPGPLQAVYYATKAYVTSFSNALDEELHDTDVSVTALLPGATETEFSRAAGLQRTDLFRRAASAEMVARKGYDAMQAGKLNVIAGLPWSQRIMLILMPLIPKRVQLRQIRKLQEAH